MSAFDKLYRSALPMKFFTKGWGKPDTLLRLIENINKVADRQKFITAVENTAPIVIEKRTEHKRVVLLEGSFISPLVREVPDCLDASNQLSRFQLVLPKDWNSNYKPICIHLAGTGDHTYSRRRLFLANRLVDDGIGSMLVMNPFYWKRKPKDQRGSNLNYVSDLFLMGGALIMECSSLLNWCESNGYGPLALHGISMGGYMASLCATVWPKPISLIPCLSWTTASVVFIQGVLANAVDWNTLTKQYIDDSVYRDTIRPLIQPSVPTCYSSVPPLASDTHNPVVFTPNSVERSGAGSSAILLHHTVDTTTTIRSDASSGLQISPIQSSNSDLKFLPSPSSHAALSAPVSASQTNFLKNSYFLSLSPLKQFNLKNTLTSWTIPEALRRPFDASLWHSGMSAFRFLPNNLSFVTNPPDPEVKQFLCELLDCFTHLGNFSPLVDPRLLLSVTAESDAYVPRQGVIPLDQLYPGSELRVLPHSGHVGAYLRNAIWTDDFRKAITDCLNRQVELYHGEPHPFGHSTQSKTSTHRSAFRKKG